MSLQLLILSLLGSAHVSVSYSLFSSDTEGFLAALGDFNNDKYVDIVVVNNVADARASLSVLYFVGGNHQPSVTRGSHNLVLEGNPAILAVIPGDFNGDSTLDILVLYADSADSTSVNFGVFWHDASSSTSFREFAPVTNLTFTGQPLVIDYNGDQIPDLLGDVSGTTRIVTTFGSNTFRDEPFSRINEGTEPNPLLPSFAHAFAHVTDNPQPDIVLGVNQDSADKLEVWSAQRPDGGYYRKYIKNFPAHSVLGNPTVVDINLNGKPDLVIPLCRDADCTHSFIYYREMENEDEPWRLMHSFEEYSTANSSPLKKFKQTSNFSGIRNNLFLRSADVNFDGYPDFLVSLEDETSAVVGLYLLTNIECEGGNDAVCDYGRALEVSKSLQNNAEIGTFFDFRENGNNDVIFSRYDGEREKFFLGSKEISDKGDDAFLKIFVIGGLCGAETYPCRFNDFNFGANLPGPTLYYDTTGNKGQRRVSVGTQLSQATHYALQPPFVIFGLGQTPNFVESLTITLASNDKVVGRMTIPNVIPNSQLILIPHPPGDPSNWDYQLLLTPSDILWKFATALGGLMLLLAAFIGILQYQEKREDDREKRQEAHKFHFDAM
jgi:integrin alpha FG-GAP repeat containing protein 1